MKKMNLTIEMEAQQPDIDIFQPEVEDRRPEIEILQPKTEERRQEMRDCVPKTITVKKKLPSGKYKTMRFRNRNISEGGAFIITENLSFFDLGDELDVVVDYGNKNGKKKYFAGKAVVIHSEAIFEKGAVKTESGYGMKFIS